MTSKNYKYALLLLLTAVIWGTAFVAQSKGSEYVGMWTFIGVRFAIAAVIMFGTVLVNNKFFKNRKNSDKAGEAEGSKKTSTRRDIKAGVICGLLLFIASSFQQAGINMGASAGKAGFLTAIYIILVPIISFFALRKKIGINVWLGVLIALLGLYMLCMKGSFSFTLPDIHLLLCALFFSFQILAVDHYAAGVDVFVMSTVEYLVCGVLGIIMMIIFEIVPQGMGSWTGSLSGAGAWITILYAAVFSSCLGYTFQNIGQSKVQPTLASLLFSLESVFAALAGWVLIHQKMTVREIIGCILVFAAVIVAQLRKSEETS